MHSIIYLYGISAPDDLKQPGFYDVILMDIQILVMNGYMAKPVSIKDITDILESNTN